MISQRACWTLRSNREDAGLEGAPDAYSRSTAASPASGSGEAAAANRSSGRNRSAAASWRVIRNSTTSSHSTGSRSAGSRSRLAAPSRTWTASSYRDRRFNADAIRRQSDTVRGDPPASTSVTTDSSSRRSAIIRRSRSTAAAPASSPASAKIRRAEPRRCAA